MTRKEVSQLIDTAVSRLQPATRYGRGRITEFNSLRVEHYPAVWQETTPEDYETAEMTPLQSPFNAEPVILWIASFDKHDSLPDQYEALIDDADLVSRKLVYEINNALTDSPTITLSSISRRAFVKKNADCLTGVILSFTINNDDTTVNCE